MSEAVGSNGSETVSNGSKIVDQKKNSESNGHATTSKSADDNTATCRLKEIAEASEYLLRNTDYRPKFAIICGSGLGALTEELQDPCQFPYVKIPHCVVSTVQGHAGQLVFGKLAGISVVCMQGRIHAYEGHPMWKTTFLVRVFASIGVRVLIATNASGGLNQALRKGDVMVMKDHINLPGLVGLNPMMGLNDERFGTRFPAVSGAYDREFRRLVLETAKELNMDFVREGVYCFQTGPCFETVIESRLMKLLGADVAGMSTVPEVLVAVHCNLRVLGLSIVTNMCVVEYDTDETTLHTEVLETVQSRTADVGRLVSAVLPKLNLSVASK